MKKLTWTEHQRMDSLKAKAKAGQITEREQVTLDKLVTRWKAVGDVPPKALAKMFRF